MSEGTKIGWTWRQLEDGSWIVGHTFNPWIGCEKVSEECKNCYALDIAAHYYAKDGKLWGPAATTSRRLMSDNYWKQPQKWNRQAQASGHRQSVFCASMSDVFEEHPDVVDARNRLWVLIEATPWLNWLLLTKRPENVLTLVPGHWQARFSDNVWIGTSVGTQRRAQERIPHLLNVPAVVRFLSCEPQLEPLDLTPWLPHLQWVINGGESGPDARRRHFELDWARALRDQCQEYSVPYFFKQVGGRYHDSGGRLLDGYTWDQMPPEVPKRQEVAV